MAAAAEYRGKGIPGHFSVGEPAGGTRSPISLDARRPSPGSEPKRSEAVARFGKVEQFAREHPQDIEALRIYAHGIGAVGVFAYMISPVKGFDSEADYLLSQIRSYLDRYAPQEEGTAASSYWEAQQILKTPLVPGWKITPDGWEINASEEYQAARNGALHIKRQNQEYQQAQQAAQDALPIPENVIKKAARIQGDARRSQEAGKPVQFNERVDEVARQLNLSAIHERNSVVRVATFMMEFSPLAEAPVVTLWNVQTVFSQVAPVVRDVIAQGNRADLEHLWFVFTRDSREPMPRQDTELQAALVDRIDRAATAISDKIAGRRESNPYVPPFITRAFTHDIPVKTVPVLTSPAEVVAPSTDSSSSPVSERVSAGLYPIVPEQDHAEESASPRHRIRLFRRRNKPAPEPKSPPRFYYGWRENPDPQYDEARTQH